jgi:DNA polymerase I
MMTPDKDYAQLVSDTVFMFKPGKAGGDAEVWGIKGSAGKFWN